MHVRLPDCNSTFFFSFYFQHEVIAVSEKVIVRLEDLVKWTVPDFSGWAHSLKAEPLKQSVLRELGNNGRREALHRYRESTLTSGLNFKDVQREKAQLGEQGNNSSPSPRPRLRRPSARLDLSRPSARRWSDPPRTALVEAERR